MEALKFLQGRYSAAREEVQVGGIHCQATEVGQDSWGEGSIRGEMAMYPTPVMVREAEIEVLNERVRDEEVGEGGIDRGHSVPATKLQRGEVGEAQGEEMDEVLFSIGEATVVLRYADVGQCFARRVDGIKNV